MGAALSMAQPATSLRALSIWFGGGPRGRVGAAHHNVVLVAKPDGIFARNVMRLRQSFATNANCRRGAHARGGARSTLYQEEEVPK
jgi:hypothetical protein